MFRLFTTAAFVLCLLPSSAGASEWLKVRIARPLGGHIHPSICQSKEGTLVVIYGHKNHVDLRITRSKDGGKTWSHPKPWVHTIGKTYYPGSLTALRDGRILHCWNRWSTDTNQKEPRSVLYSLSSDEGVTWSSPKAFPRDPKVRSIIRHPIVELPDNRWLVSLSDKTFVFDPKTDKSKNFGDGRVHGLVPIVRTPKGTFVSGAGLRSTDGGQTWNPVADMPDVKSQGWRHEMVCLPNGALLASQILGPGFGGERIRYVVSTDDGKSWKRAFEYYNPGRAINGRACPRTIQLDKKTLGVVFYDIDKKQRGGPGLFFMRIPLWETLQSTTDARTAAGEPRAGQGIMVGEVTHNSAIIQLRLTETDRLVNRDVKGSKGMVHFEIELEPNRGDDVIAAGSITSAEGDDDFLTRVSFTDLAPNTVYTCKTTIEKGSGSKRPGPTARFKTLPGPKQSKPVRFVVVTGMNYAKFHGDNRIDKKIHKEHNNTALPKPYAGPDKHLGYPGLASILQKRPDFFVGTGDNVYYDTPKKPRAETLAEMRQKWHEQFVQPRYRDLFARVPTYWEIDDHDYRIDDGDNTGDYKPSPALGRRVMLEQLPIAPQGAKNVKTYRTHRVSKELQIWFVEGRMYRSPNTMKDGPGKTIWGAEQKAWLKRTLKASDAKFKLLISPTPMVGPDDARKTDNHTNIGGFRHERDEFFAWLKETGLDKRGFYLVCGDRHWQYHARHPTGIEEFSCGALVDANSRLGRKPGDPKSTDPKGLIKQLYTQKVRSGGFLMIGVTPAAKSAPAKLTFQWFDEFGKLLHQHVKPAR